MTRIKKSSKQDSPVTLKQLVTILKANNSELTENIVYQIDKKMNQQFKDQWFAVESKFNELREEMFAKFDEVNNRITNLDLSLNEKMDKVKEELVQNICDAEEFTRAKTSKLKDQCNKRFEPIEQNIFGFVHKFDN